MRTSWGQCLIWCPLPLHTLASGQYLLNQTALRFQWNQNLVVAFCGGERNEEPERENKWMCCEFFKVSDSEVPCCCPWWRVAKPGFIPALRSLGLPRSPPVILLLILITTPKGPHANCSPPSKLKLSRPQWVYFNLKCELANLEAKSQPGFAPATNTICICS